MQLKCPQNRGKREVFGFVVFCLFFLLTLEKNNVVKVFLPLPKSTENPKHPTKIPKTKIQRIPKESQKNPKSHNLDVITSTLFSALFFFFFFFFFSFFSFFSFFVRKGRKRRKGKKSRLSFFSPLPPVHKKKKKTLAFALRFSKQFFPVLRSRSSTFLSQQLHSEFVLSSRSLSHQPVRLLSSFDRFPTKTPTPFITNSSSFLFSRNFCDNSEIMADSAAANKPVVEKKKPSKGDYKNKKKEKKEKKETDPVNAAKEARKKEFEAKKAAKESAGEGGKKIRMRDEFVNETKPGEKKDLSGVMADSYSPAGVEAAWYEWWEAKGLFHANEEEKADYEDKGKFVMVIPPPNVTGTLHIGHALTNAVEDTICRYHRMKGKQVLWVPGCDHAGIATQVVVEKQLMKNEGLTRHDLGREKFLEKVWDWKNEKGSRIFEQLKRLGSSLDWRRTAFTLDPKLQTAVTEAFVRMHDDGLIYRETRLVNWCCTLKTAISDIEVDKIELTGKTKRRIPGYEGNGFDFGIIEDFGYGICEKDGAPFLGEDGEQEVMTISTTRLETMLGDTAVAIHPDDERYKKWHNKCAWHPYRKTPIPIILDSELVDMAFGTGCVKITPAHDPNDYACGKRNGLEILEILTDDGNINEIGGELFAGMKRYNARIAIRKDLKAAGKHFAIRDNPMVLSVCSRSGDLIEPMLKPQWWVNCDKMAADAVKAVKEKELQILPEQFESTWFNWLENIQPWCISRQLWWGHRIPAWLVYKKGDAKPQGTSPEDWVVGRTFEDVQGKALTKFGVASADELVFEQDEDVLDTWFSSGLFPFSVFGWPNETADFKHFYPNSLLETGHDILFFWVARMVMMGIQLTGQLPFKQVYLHSIVFDAQGRKMSKTLGNVIDPVDVIEGIALQDLHDKLLTGNLDPKELKTAKEGQKKSYPKGISECGTDALRFALCTYTSQGTKINLNIDQVVADRNFCNKMWNVVKFAMQFLGEEYKAPEAGVEGVLAGRKHRLEDEWILSLLEESVEKANEGFDELQLGKATTAIKSFIIDSLCDVYLESMKPLMYMEGNEGEQEEMKAAARDTLYVCLDTMFRLLHPFMPFVTEELWQRLPRRANDPFSIMIASYPSPQNSAKNAQVEQQMKTVMEVVRTGRRVRSDYGLTKQKPRMWVRCGGEEKKFLKQYFMTVEFLCGTGEGMKELGEGEVPEGNSIVRVIVPNCKVELFVDMKGMIDFDKEIGGLEKRVANLEKAITLLKKKMDGKNYAKVPEKVKKENDEKLAASEEQLGKAAEALESMKKMKEQEKE